MNGASGGGTGRGSPSARLPTLLESVLHVDSDAELHHTLQRIVDTATDLIGARYGALGVVDPERGMLDELFTSGLSDVERQRSLRLPDPHTGLLGVLIEERRPLRLEELTTDPRSAGFPPGHPLMHAFLGVPVELSGEVFGNLYLTEKRAGSFTEEDEGLLRMFASQAGIAIGNARLYRTARRRERWIEGAATVTRALLTGESAADALTTVAESARTLAEASAGIVLLPTASGGMEVVAASTADDENDLVGTTIEAGSPVLVPLLSGEPVFIEDAASDPLMTTPVRGRFGPSMMLPLQSGGKLIGTLVLPRGRGGHPYSAADRSLATQFASQAALALVLVDVQHNRERLAVYEDRDRIARDLHDLVVQRLFATEMMLESTRRRITAPDLDVLVGRAVDELDSTIQEVRTAIFALQQPPADALGTLRGQVLRETKGNAPSLGFQPSVQFRGPVDTLLGERVREGLLTALREALDAVRGRPRVTWVSVEIDATVSLPDGQPGVQLTVTDDGTTAEGAGGPGEPGTTVTWRSPRV